MPSSPLEGRRIFSDCGPGCLDTVAEAVQIIDALSAARLAENVRVQGYEKSVLEVVYHVVEHFSQHTGQIIYITKALQKQDLGFYSHLKSPTHGEKTP